MTYITQNAYLTVCHRFVKQNQHCYVNRRLNNGLCIVAAGKGSVCLRWQSECIPGTPRPACRDTRDFMTLTSVHRCSITSALLPWWWSSSRGRCVMFCWTRQCCQGWATSSRTRWVHSEVSLNASKMVDNMTEQLNQRCHITTFTMLGCLSQNGIAVTMWWLWEFFIQ